MICFGKYWRSFYLFSWRQTQHSFCSWWNWFGVYLKLPYKNQKFLMWDMLPSVSTLHGEWRKENWLSYQQKHIWIIDFPQYLFLSAFHCNRFKNFLYYKFYLTNFLISLCYYRCSYYWVLFLSGPPQFQDDRFYICCVILYFLNSEINCTFIGILFTRIVVHIAR